MKQMLHIGFENFIPLDDIELIAGNPLAANNKKRIAEAKVNNKLADCSAGRKTKSVIYMQGGNIVLCAISSKTLNDRCGATLQPTDKPDTI